MARPFLLHEQLDVGGLDEVAHRWGFVVTQLRLALRRGDAKAGENEHDAEDEYAQEDAEPGESAAEHAQW
jgi:hypothetical protein